MGMQCCFRDDEVVLRRLAFFGQGMHTVISCERLTSLLTLKGVLSGNEVPVFALKMGPQGLGLVWKPLLKVCIPGYSEGSLGEASWTG